jgi:hypothetical protein
MLHLETALGNFTSQSSNGAPSDFQGSLARSKNQEGFTRWHSVSAVNLLLHLEHVPAVVVFPHVGPQGPSPLSLVSSIFSLHATRMGHQKVASRVPYSTVPAPTPRLAGGACLRFAQQWPHQAHTVRRHGPDTCLAPARMRDKTAEPQVPAPYMLKRRGDPARQPNGPVGN